MKIAFYTVKELNEISKDIYKSEGTAISCKVGYSEKLKCDAVELYDNDVLVKTVSVQELLGSLGEQLQVTITHFDVIEIGDFGEGFAFFF